MSGGEFRLTRFQDSRGRFLKMEADLKNLMLVEAKEYQQEVAQYMETHFKRKGDLTGRLIEATTDRRNLRVNNTGWQVGIPDFLNQSQAKYWRLIEQGSAGLYAHGHGFRGTPLYFFGDRGPARPFRSVGRGTPAQEGPFLANGSFRNRGRIRYVRNEIQPMHAYSIVFEENGWRERTQRDFLQIVRKGFIL